MRKLFIFLLLVLVSFFLVPVASAKYLTKNDFSISVEGLKDYYLPNEKVTLKVKIEPKNDDIAKDMSNRKYTFQNNLNEPKMEVTIKFKDGPSYTRSSTEKTIVIGKDYTNWDEGIESIVVNLTGYVPSIDGGLSKKTVFELDIDNAERILINITIVNPSKLQSEIADLKSRLAEIESKINELSKKTDVTELKDKLNDVKSDLNDVEVLFNNKHYEDVSVKIGNVTRDINELELDVTKTEAKYYVDRAKDLLDQIEVNYTKAESLIDILQSSGKNVVEYKLKLADLKVEKDRIGNSVRDLKDSFDSGDYEKVIDEGDSILKSEETILSEIAILIEDLQAQITTTVTTTTTTVTTVTTVNHHDNNTASFKVDWGKVGLYAGMVGVIVVVVAVSIIGLRRYIRRRRWDELK
jgi:hypothetical protein